MMWKQMAELFSISLHFPNRFCVQPKKKTFALEQILKNIPHLKLLEH